VEIHANRAGILIQAGTCEARFLAELIVPGRDTTTDNEAEPEDNTPLAPVESMAPPPKAGGLGGKAAWRHIDTTMHAKRAKRRMSESHGRCGGRADDSSASNRVWDHGSVSAERFARASSLARRNRIW